MHVAVPGQEAAVEASMWPCALEIIKERLVKAAHEQVLPCWQASLGGGFSDLALYPQS